MNMADNDEMKIKILKNGPYMVSGSVPLIEEIMTTNEEGHVCEWREGVHYPLKERYTICRCGASKNKPFCDGTHIKINFDGTETASKENYRDKARKIEVKDFVLNDVWDLCDHSRFCLRGGGIRELLKSEDPEDIELAIEEAKSCPSGRLVLWDKKTGQPVEPEFEPSIVLVNDPQKQCDGPVWVRGGIPIESTDGSTYEIRNRVTICRCGKSENKPFCDGRHWMSAEEKQAFREKWTCPED
jgi:CDGSH-type Zn-finger protein